MADLSCRIAHFVKHARPQARFQGLWRCKVDRPAQNFDKAIPKGGKFVEIWGLVEFNKDIHIALRTCFSTGYRPVDAKPPHTGARKLCTVHCYPGEEFVSRHGTASAQV